MKIVVLLSAGLHPVSGQSILPKVEAQALRLALALGEARGRHAGPTAFPASDALGHGLPHLVHVEIPAEADPVPALVATLEADQPDLILAGRRGQGGDETGLAPYAVASRLGMALVSDAIAVERGEADGTVIVHQALPKGARRRLVVRLPAVVTVHPDAPAPRAFAYGVARRGIVETRLAPPGLPAAERLEERPYRRRPKLMRSAPACGSASERLAAAMGATSSGVANVMVNPTPEEAARAILAHLRAIGVLPPKAA
ncbi:electron transfer flavoprotein subunit beta [Hansschlegelia quercus]|uniref:Electron transfer flavoprotein subunit beta n=1 Tax=Hansschlegelia quercus TaxID=2528245 RepID=A0A4Q9GCS6_9HYPH|nr:electron transfer flavoprotein subunit beta [Hansschlegelia quercus]TBN47338.1 electron transfer flavoprotein subunit beta [Hansschlegelia quercus]